MRVVLILLCPRKGRISIELLREAGEQLLMSFLHLYVTDAVSGYINKSSFFPNRRSLCFNVVGWLDLKEKYGRKRY